jgi:hypothetical protein
MQAKPAIYHMLKGLGIDIEQIDELIRIGLNEVPKAIQGAKEFERRVANIEKALARICEKLEIDAAREFMALEDKTKETEQIWF